MKPWPSLSKTLKASRISSSMSLSWISLFSLCLVRKEYFPHSIQFCPRCNFWGSDFQIYSHHHIWPRREHICWILKLDFSFQKMLILQCTAMSNDPKMNLSSGILTQDSNIFGYSVKETDLIVQKYLEPYLPNIYLTLVISTNTLNLNQIWSNFMHWSNVQIHYRLKNSNIFC